MRVTGMVVFPLDLRHTDQVGVQEAQMVATNRPG